MPQHRPGAVSKIADPEVAELVAQMFANGSSRQEIADEFDIKDLKTISRWRRDPRVKNRVLKLIEDRVLEVTRKTDSVIAQRLQNAEDLTIKELLDIRREFLGGQLRAQTERADEGAITDAVEALEENPDLMEELEELLKRKEA